MQRVEEKELEGTSSECWTITDRAPDRHSVSETANPSITKKDQWTLSIVSTMAFDQASPCYWGSKR